MNKLRFFNWLAMLTLGIVITSCAMEPEGEGERVPTFTFDPTGLPVGFDRQAGVITFEEGSSSFDTIDTRYPVLHFTGPNVDNTMIAYTSLALPDEGHEGGFVDVNLADAMVVPLMNLVPSGRLVLERPDGTTTTILRDHSYIVAAAWHPTDPNLIGFSYMEGDHYGLSVYDVRTSAQEDVLQDDLTPELIVWSDDGSSLGAYMADPTLPRRETPAGHEGMYDIAHRWQHIMVPMIDRAAFVEQPTFDHGSMNFIESSSLSEIAFESGGLATLPEGFSSGSILFERRTDDGSSLAVELRADQIRHLSRRGLAFVNFDEDGMTLFASDGAEMPGLIRTVSSVTYYIPLHSGEDSYLTQVGSGYGGGCSVWNHTGNLAYAVDIQIPYPYYGDEVIASANGTISGGASWVTCNWGDTSDCSPSCATYAASNYGWGNYVMIAHSDGRYTLYAHLENTNYQVSMSGVSVYRGCWLADEGGTGASSGIKNGCGDHVHFQWQNSGSLGSASVSGSFSEVTLGTGSCGWRATSTGAMSCSL